MGGAQATTGRVWRSEWGRVVGYCLGYCLPATATAYLLLLLPTCFCLPATASAYFDTSCLFPAVVPPPPLGGSIKYYMPCCPVLSV